MRRLLAPFLLSLGAVACGGNDEKPRPPDPGACRPIVPLVDYPDPWGGPVDCNALDGYEVLLLDDFEPPVTEQAWYINNDRTAEQDPPADTNAPPHLSPIPGGRCGQRGAMHILTGHLSNNGGQLGQTLAKCPAAPAADPDRYTCTAFTAGSPEQGACSTADAPTRGQLGCTGFDASAWEGIVLWARVGPGSQASVKVRTADRATDDKGCQCNPYTNQNDSSDGCDKWGTFIQLDGTFRAYRVPFSELQQGGWGAASPGLDTAELFSIAVEYGRGSWDLWLDDIGFYRSRR